MNVNGKNQVEVSKLNVVSLFNQGDAFVITEDPIKELIEEAQISEEIVQAAPKRTSKVVSETQFPDQSMYVLEEQLSNLKSRLNKMKFYLEELDDVIPR